MRCSARAFDAARARKLRERRIEFIKAAKDSEPQSLIGIYGRALLFARASLRQAGRRQRDAASRRSSAEDLQQFYARAFRRRSADAGVRRRLRSAGAARGGRRAAFGGWRAAGAPLPPLPPPQRVARTAGAADRCARFGADLFLDRQHRRGARLSAARGARDHQHGLRRQLRLDADAGAAREERADAIPPCSSFHRGSVPGEFAISSFTQTASTTRAIDSALRDARPLKQQGVGADAIDSARSYILGQYPLRLGDRGRLGRGAGGSGSVRAAGQLHRRLRGALDTVDEAQSRRVIDEAFPDSADVDIVLIGECCADPQRGGAVWCVERAGPGSAGIQLTARMPFEVGRSPDIRIAIDITF